MNIITYIFQHKLSRNTLVYAGANSVKSGIPILLLPVLTRYLTPSDYGIIATFQVFLAIAVVFIGLSMRGNVTVSFFKLNKDKLKIYIGNTVLIAIINFSFTLIFIYIFKAHLSQFIRIPENWLLIAIIVALCQSVFMLNLAIWQAEQKALPYGLFQILYMVLDVGLTLVFVIVLSWKWEGRLLSITFANITLFFLSIFVIYKWEYITFSFNKVYIKDALYFGIPIVPHVLGSWIMTSSDRLFINSMVDIAATGIYVVGYQVGMIIGLVAGSFNKAWTPFLFETLKDNIYSAKVKIVKLTYLYFVVIIAMAIMLSMVAPVILKAFLGEKFVMAHKYVFWIALGSAANGMYYMVVNYIFYVKKTYILAWTTILSAIINIVLNYFLIKANGPIGAAQATAISFFICFILTWIMSARVYEMPWGLRQNIYT